MTQYFVPIEYVSISYQLRLRDLVEINVAQISRFTQAHRPAEVLHTTRRIAKNHGTEAQSPQAIIPFEINQLVRCGRGARPTRRSGMDKLLSSGRKKGCKNEKGRDRTLKHMISVEQETCGF